MSPQDADKNAGYKPGSRGGPRKSYGARGGGKYNRDNKEQDNKEKAVKQDAAAQGERKARTPYNRKTVKSGGQPIARNPKQGRPYSQQRQDKQGAAGTSRGPLRDDEHREYTSGGPVAGPSANAAQASAPVSAQNVSGAANMQGKQNAQAFNAPSIQGAPAAHNAAAPQNASFINNPSVNASSVNAAFTNAASAGSAGGAANTAARGQKQASQKAADQKGGRQPQERGGARERDHERERDVPAGREQPGRGKAQGGTAKSGAAIPAGARTHGMAGGQRGRHGQAAYAQIIKAEETLEDIKADIVRIEKEIDLEIKEIQSLKLAL